MKLINERFKGLFNKFENFKQIFIQMILNKYLYKF